MGVMCILHVMQLEDVWGVCREARTLKGSIPSILDIVVTTPQQHLS